MEAPEERLVVGARARAPQLDAYNMLVASAFETTVEAPVVVQIVVDFVAGMVADGREARHRRAWLRFAWSEALHAAATAHMEPNYAPGKLHRAESLVIRERDWFHVLAHNEPYLYEDDAAAAALVYDDDVRTGATRRGGILAPVYRFYRYVTRSSVPIKIDTPDKVGAVVQIALAELYLHGYGIAWIDEHGSEARIDTDAVRVCVPAAGARIDNDNDGAPCLGEVRRVRQTFVHRDEEARRATLAWWHEARRGAWLRGDEAPLERLLRAAELQWVPKAALDFDAPIGAAIAPVAPTPVAPVAPAPVDDERLVERVDELQTDLRKTWALLRNARRTQTIAVAGYKNATEYFKRYLREKLRETDEQFQSHLANAERGAQAPAPASSALVADRTPRAPLRSGKPFFSDYGVMGARRTVEAAFCEHTLRQVPGAPAVALAPPPEARRRRRVSRRLPKAVAAPPAARAVIVEEPEEVF